jgi:hypothetical protein
LAKASVREIQGGLRGGCPGQEVVGAPHIDVVPAVLAGSESTSGRTCSYGGGNLAAVDPAPWAARPDLVVPTILYHHSFPDSVMGVGVGDIVGGSVDWGDHFFRWRWSAGHVWFGGSRSIFQSQLRVGEAFLLVKTELIGGRWRQSTSFL